MTNGAGTVRRGFMNNCFTSSEFEKCMLWDGIQENRIHYFQAVSAFLNSKLVVCVVIKLSFMIWDVQLWTYRSSMTCWARETPDIVFDRLVEMIWQGASHVLYFQLKVDALDVNVITLFDLECHNFTCPHNTISFLFLPFLFPRLRLICRSLRSDISLLLFLIDIYCVL